MLALVYDGSLRLDLHNAPPSPAPGWALIKVSRAGICNTDLEITRGYAQYAGIIGHEFVGRVVAPDTSPFIGDRVVGEINIPCRTCADCVRGLSNHCGNRTVLGIVGHPGCMAEFVTLPEANLHVVPQELSDNEATFVEPLAAALEIAEQVHIKPSETAIVLGDGKLGLLCAQAMRLTGCRVVLGGHHRPKMALARSLGIEAVHSSELEGMRARLVVEATGSANGLAQAKSIVEPRGTIVLKSTTRDTTTIDLSPFVVDEITLQGSRCGPFAAALRVLQQRQVQVEPMITAIYPLTEALAAFERACQPDSVKVLIDC